MSTVVVVTGTGTEIGKTHLAEALLRAWGARGARTLGVKPVESGVDGAERTDASRLDAASTFHVKPPGVALPDPVSPHLAARRVGIALDPDQLARAIDPFRDDVDILLVELAGGLFSPLSASATNADLAVRLRPDAVILVVPDRLGVLHDAMATLRAASLTPLHIDGLVLMAPPTRDPSTGTNEAELRLLIPNPVVASLPRESVDVLAQGTEVSRIVSWVASLAGRAPGQ